MLLSALCATSMLQSAQAADSDCADAFRDNSEAGWDWACEEEGDWFDYNECPDLQEEWSTSCDNFVMGDYCLWWNFDDEWSWCNVDKQLAPALWNPMWWYRTIFDPEESS